jgi:hypothetical protein
MLEFQTQSCPFMGSLEHDSDKWVKIAGEGGARPFANSF